MPPYSYQQQVGTSFERADENGTLLQTLKNDNIWRERKKINPRSESQGRIILYQFETLKTTQTGSVLPADEELEIYLVRNDS